MARNEREAEAGLNLISRLALLELPRPGRPEDVRDAFDGWLSSEALDEEELAEVQILRPRASPFPLGPRGEREDALIALLRHLVPGGFLWRRIDNCADLMEQLDRIRRVLEPVDAVMTFLRAEAAAIVSTFWQRNNRDPRNLRDFFDGSPTSLLEDEIVRLPFGVEVPLAHAIDADGLDGLGLWNLRAVFPDQSAEFDTVVARRRMALAPLVGSYLFGMFGSSDREPPSPAQFLSAFGHLMAAGAAIALILPEIEKRISSRDGFEGGHDQAAWFDALATLNGWRPEHIRKLVYLDMSWMALGDPGLRALLRAIERIAAFDRQSAAFGAFHAHRVARSIAEEGRALADAKRLAMVEDRVGALPDGSVIVGLSKHLAALPLLVRSRDCVWHHCGSTTKAMWRDDVKAFVEKDVGLSQGLTEFVIAYASRDALDEIETLVIDLLDDIDGIHLLEGMAEGVLDGPSGGMAYLAGMRARGILRQMST